MGRVTSTPSTTTPSTRGLSAISNLTDTKKARLFDHLQSAQTNTTNKTPADDSTTNGEQVVYLANAYSALAQHKTKNHDMVSDSGADCFIFNSIKQFINLRATAPIAIKTADGSCNMVARHTGDAVVNSYDKNNKLHMMTLPETLHCPDILRKLI